MSSLESCLWMLKGHNLLCHDLIGLLMVVQATEAGKGAGELRLGEPQIIPSWGANLGNQGSFREQLDRQQLAQRDPYPQQRTRSERPMQAMNPSLSFSLDERTVAALLQEDESTFNMLGSLLPTAASAALAAAEAQLGDPSALQAANAAAMHHLLQLHAGQVEHPHLAYCLYIHPWHAGLFCPCVQLHEGVSPKREGEDVGRMRQKGSMLNGSAKDGSEGGARRWALRRTRTRAGSGPTRC